MDKDKKITSPTGKAYIDFLLKKKIIKHKFVKSKIKIYIWNSKQNFLNQLLQEK